jgi:MFS family permease
MRPDPAAASRLPAYRALAVTVVTLALAYGVWYAYSVFLVALLREFGWSRSVLAGAFSLFTLVSGGAGPVLGALADRFGPRRLILMGGALLAASLWADSFVTRAWHLYVAFGLVTAIGVATAGWTPAVVMVQRQWSARLGLALGIAGSGVGLGIFLVVPLCQALIDAFGWRWAFRGLGTLARWPVPRFG